MDFDPKDYLALSEQTFQLLLELVIALAIGLIVGLEREYASNQKDKIKENEELFAGIRTFPLVALSGYLCAYLSTTISLWIFPIGLLAVGVFAMLSYYLGSLNKPEGATSEFALIAVFLISALVHEGEYLLSVFLGLLIAVLLTFKVRLHKAVARLSRREVLSIFLFIAISALVLPMLPDKDFGPYGIFNPFKIWFITTIFIALNFVAYFLHKFIDSKYSILTTGILGGFISSTATAWYFSRQGGKVSTGGMTHVGAILIASSIMFPRLLIWLVILNPALIKSLWIPVLVLGAIIFAVGFYYTRKSLVDEEYEERNIGNPINLKDAAIFGAVYVLILLVVGLAEDFLGESGVLIAAGISGLTDVDAITISMAEYGGESIAASTAVTAILMAALANTWVKYVFCLLFGNAMMRRYASWGFLPVFLLGVGYIVFLLLR